MQDGMLTMTCSHGDTMTRWSASLNSNDQHQRWMPTPPVSESSRDTTRGWANFNLEHPTADHCLSAKPHYHTSTTTSYDRYQHTTSCTPSHLIIYSSHLAASASCVIASRRIPSHHVTSHHISPRLIRYQHTSPHLTQALTHSRCEMYDADAGTGTMPSLPWRASKTHVPTGTELGSI